MPAPRLIVASPSYLERRGTTHVVDDLGVHNCLGFNFRRTAPVWPLRDCARIVDRSVLGNLLTNNGATVRHLAVAGVGLGRLGEYHVQANLAAGRLVEVLADVGCGDEEEIHALHIGGEFVPQRIRLFLDFMIPRLRSFLIV